MKTDREIMNTGFESIFSSLGMVDAQRFIALLKRDKFDYTEWQWKLWPDETVESLSEKAQQAWIELHRDELMADWELAVIGENPYKIAPL
ncbi:MAG: hypothetical protein PHD39_08225 [Methylobacter tundripaludum]|jgi:hypothetical protein|nr:hypothetical protein [Methylobacter tundripaludum]